MKYLYLLLATLAAPALAQEVSPDALVKDVTQEVISIIKQDKDFQAGSARKIADLVGSKILPHFDFAHMARLAVAVNWRKASPEQREAITREFRILLVRTYSGALSNYRDQRIEFMPLRARTNDTEVTVKSEVKQRGAPPVSIDYEMEKTSTGWMVFDVKVGGVSLVTAYKEDFARQVREGGVDGLIKALAAKNRQAEVRARQ